MRITADIDGDAAISTTELSKRLGVPVSTKLMDELGFKPLAVLANGTYWLAGAEFAYRAMLSQFIQLGREEFHKWKKGGSSDYRRENHRGKDASGVLDGGVVRVHTSIQGHNPRA